MRPLIPKGFVMSDLFDVSKETILITTDSATLGRRRIRSRRRHPAAGRQRLALHDRQRVVTVDGGFMLN
jgi:hypothetical protein